MKCKNLGPRVAKSLCLLNVFAQPDHKFLRFVIQDIIIIMILSDKDIKKSIKKKELIFYPKLTNDQIGPASIDLKLSNIFKVFHTEKQSLLDTKKGLPKNFTKTIKLKKGENFILHPNNFVIASTVERIKVPDNMVIRVEGKSSLARMGVLVHTAGFVDPGFEGEITLEIS